MIQQRRWGEGFLGLPPMISQLILINAIAYLAQALLPERLLYHGTPMVPNGIALVPSQVITRGMVWELVTYMFLHRGMWHLLFNMLGLAIFGADLERWWGGRAFLRYYLVTGAGAGVIHIASAYIFGGSATPVVGASGAIFGVLIAFAMAFPNRQVLWMFLIPISARTLVIIYGFMELASAVQYPGGGVARFAHLGGMLVGFVYLRQERFFWRAKRWTGRIRTSLQERGRQSDAERQRKIDLILDKIAREGMGSLSEEEKRFLHDSAERARRRQEGR